MKIRQFIKHLEEAGYQFVRYGKGSHIIFFNPTTNHTFAVSGNKEAKPYQLKFIR